mmetsp:Transcript_40785/g.73412  ORF Transcript_40785/g.73412 Transcript_40785/m.73412 type:complete len:130 (-) Transcript_40785:73-462(-)
MAEGSSELESVISISVHNVTGDVLLPEFQVATSSTVSEIQLACQQACSLGSEYYLRILWEGMELESAARIGDVGLQDGCFLTAVTEVNPALNRVRVLAPELNADEVCSTEGSECPSEAAAPPPPPPPQD